MAVKKYVKDLMIARVQTIKEDSTVKDTCKSMSKYNIGAIVVVDNNERPIGIFTERDLLNRVISVDKTLDDPVKEYMTKNVQHVELEDHLEDVPSIMLNGNFRHLPVLSQSKVVGMISMRDVLRFMNLLLDDELFNIGSS
jgi:signal-transduction protein with cAMP-binding, CBS, and nucleotidyltransferase domain